MTATIYAFCNQKGGVGKTTVTFHIADAARRAGLKVLAVDMDPQGNLSTILTKEPIHPGDAGIADVLSDRSEATLGDIISEGLWPGVELAATVPDAETLAAVRDELVIAGAGREHRLRDALDAVRNNYDLILIDCPPSLDQLTINALVAADQAVIVSQSALFSANGLARLRRTIDAVRRSYHPTLTLRGVIVNLHEAQTIAGQEQLDEIAASADIIGYPVPKAVVIKDASEAQTSLEEWGSTRARSLATIFRDITTALIGENRNGTSAAS
ncbi:ParA family protein (plasmid) [Prescottella equi]|uniref:ParA family protein n=1 Tax=Rhodococcus hoagii TaxID=43767 RepID=UPI0025768A85|nr:ParA family protein [Prescottella equi]WJJ14673.1 ParA family protein [Prescottella equi]